MRKAFALGAALLFMLSGCGIHNGGSTIPFTSSLQESLPDQTSSDASQADQVFVTPESAQSSASGDASSALSMGPAVAGVPKHVLTAALIYDYEGVPTSVPLSLMAPYVSWSYPIPSYAVAMMRAGIKVFVYADWARNHKDDNPNVGYLDIKPGGLHADAEVKTCSGAVSYDPTYGGGYEANSYKTGPSEEHASLVVNYRKNIYQGHYDAIFLDGVGGVGGMPLPCGYTVESYIAATNVINTYLRVPIIINSLGVGNYVAQVGLTAPSNIIGAMCEGGGCYAGWRRINGVIHDYSVIGATWAMTENAEIATIARRKIFWDYARAAGNPALETGLRKFIIASFLLTYDPRYAMIMTAFQSRINFTVQPESGLVPLNPLKTSVNVGSYKVGGVYMRQFGACYYRGASVGPCAVVVNPSTATVSVPSNTYAHSMNMVGGGVLDGGYVTFTGGRVTTLGPAGGAILFR